MSFLSFDMENSISMVFFNRLKDKILIKRVYQGRICGDTGDIIMRHRQYYILPVAHLEYRRIIWL